MKRAAAQLWVLLRLAWILDMRAGGRFRGHSRARGAFVLTLILHLCIGVALATGAISALPLFLRCTTYFMVAAFFVAFHVLVEYQQILFSTTDLDVLFWRPIGSRTLFLARVLHITSHVGLLTTALLLGPMVDVILQVETRRSLVGVVFWIAGLVHGCVAAALVVAVYAWLLRVIRRDRFQPTLVWIQITMAVSILFIYQGLGPVLESLHLQEHSLPRWIHVFPAAWFARLPASVSGSVEVAGLAVTGVAAIALSLGAWVAWRVLAPRFATNLVEAMAEESPIRLPRPPARRLSKDRLLSFCLGRESMLRGGYDFLAAHLRGDRRLQLGLVPAFAMPLVYLGFGLILGHGWDPYAKPSMAWGSEPVGDAGFAPGRDILAGSGGRDRAQQSEAFATRSTQRRTVVALFGASYLLVMVSVLTVRSLSTSTAWRAAWVFFAAPTRRFDAFYLGILAAAAIELLLPVASIAFLSLAFTWRDPLHAAAHLALPVGISAVSVAVLVGLEPTVPFAREPVRHERSFNLLVSVVILVPLAFMVWGQYALRAHPLLLVLAGFLVLLASVLPFHFARRRLRVLALDHAFDA
ncbi:MAG TPA: hypothetical protein VFD07_09555 [Candidatus Krumholzibacteria bacterium]|nr:hypothetical protein [Candidatus Krumholzibacteria bacterium]